MRDLRWERNGVPLLDVPVLDLEGPGLIILTGPSGAGKSSLLKALTGTLGEFHGGHVRGTVRAQRGGSVEVKVGFVPQDARDAFLAHDARTEFQLRLQALGWRYRAAREESLRLLETHGLADRATVPVHRLSAGERRRLALFASRIHRPEVLLLDEPLNHLDARWRTILLNDVSGFAEKALVVVATHEPEPWLPIATSRIHIDAGALSPSPPSVGGAASRSWTGGPAAPSGPLLVALDVRDARDLFQAVTLRLGRGLHAIAGPNGSGKSTLLRILGGLERPGAGTVLFRGRDVHSLSSPQLAAFRAHHIEEPRETFFLEHANGELGFQPANAGFSRSDTDERAWESVKAFRLDALVERHPLSLSGGEQERLALGCTRAARADLLLLDEPTHGLDAQGRADLLRFLEETSRTACVLLATHDEALLQHCDSIHTFDGGRLRLVRDERTPILVEVRTRAP